MNVDPIELELMRNLFEAAAEEMGIALQRTAFSANIKERRDFSCALFDSSGTLLAQAAHIPVHLGSMPASLLSVIDRLGPLEAGDVAIVNDPFAGGTHLPDITIVSPIHFENRLIAYAANRAHHADVGGISPGSMTLSRHIDEEGIRIEPALLYRGGERDEALLRRILNAVRTPNERLGDLDAQLSANRAGENSLRRMFERHGVDHVLRFGRALLDYSQSFMYRTIATIPPGVYEFEDAMDDDGAGSGPVAIRARVTIEPNRVVVDLRESADQVAGCINCPRAVAVSAVYYCFACLMESSLAASQMQGIGKSGLPICDAVSGECADAPLNGGAFRDIEVRTRPGSVVDAQYPSAVVAGNTETSQRVVDVVFGALASALPDRIPAASCGSMSSVALGTDDWSYYETIGGGSGASAAGEGASGIQCHMTNTLNTPAEALELQYPLRVRRFERAASTGGAGRFHGGDGIVREIEALADCTGTILSDRRSIGPHGLSGGGRGRAGENTLLNQHANETTGAAAGNLGGKSQFRMKAGQRLRIQTPGGGGWGSQ
ncbi:hydantoinase B/oxoprolinase family protein [soil metagenome]